MRNFAPKQDDTRIIWTSVANGVHLGKTDVLNLFCFKCQNPILTFDSLWAAPETWRCSCGNDQKITDPTLADLRWVKTPEDTRKDRGDAA